MAGALSEETMASNELVSPTSQKPFGDAGAKGFATIAGGDVGRGESYRCEERSAEVAVYEECANAAPRQSSARMPKMRSK